MNTVHKILDIFEDFLEDKGVWIENEDREGDEGEAILCGMDYDRLYEEIKALIEKEPVAVHVGALDFYGKCCVAEEKIEPCIEVTSDDFDAWFERMLRLMRKEE